MRTKKVGKKKEKIIKKGPKTTMDLLKNELYNIIRDEDETNEKKKKKARRNRKSYREFKEKELLKTMEGLSKTIKDLEIDIDRATKLIEEMISLNRGKIPSDSSEEVENITIGASIEFSGESYSIGSLVDKLRAKYENSPFTSSMARSVLFTSKKRPIKKDWEDFLEGLVKESVLKKSNDDGSKGKIRYMF